MSVGPILSAPPIRHNAAEPLAVRLDEVRPLLLMRRWFVIASSSVAVGMLLRVLPGSPGIVTVLFVLALLMFTEKTLVERSSSVQELDRWLAVFAAANVGMSTVLVHLASDALWLPVISYAVNVVAGGTALKQRSLVGITALASASFALYAAFAVSDAIHPLTLFGDVPAYELRTGDEGGSVVVGVGVAFLVSGFALPALAALSYGMTARLRATRDDLQAANADLDTAYGEVVEARRALDRWNAQLNDEVLAKTVAVEEQNRFLTAINAISSALNATIEDAESPMRLGQLIARLLNLDAVQFYALLEPGEQPMNMVVTASGDIAHAVAPVDAALLRAVAEGGDPVFEAPDGQGPDRDSGELALAIVPLSARERSLGALALVGARPRGWNEDERRLLRLVGREVGVSFENARLYRAALMARVRETALSHALNILARPLDHASPVPQAMQLIGDALDGAYVCFVSNGKDARRSVLFEAAQRHDWIDRASLAGVAATAAALSVDRSHAMLLGPRGESPVSALLLGRGIGSMILAPVLATRLEEHTTSDTGQRATHSYEVVGTLVAMAAVGMPWGPAEADVFERLAAGVARRLESDALVAVQKRRIRELAGLARLVTRMQTTIDTGHLYDGFAVAMAGLLDYSDLYLFLLPDMAGESMLRRYGAGGAALAHEAVSLTPGARWLYLDAPIFWTLPDGAAPTFLPPDARWAIAAPMRARGQPLGLVIAVLPTRPDTEIVGIAGQAAEQLALALDSALLYRQASDRAARIQVLGQLARIVASAADLREAFGVFAEEVRWLVSFDRAFMLLANESEGVFEVYASYPGSQFDGPSAVTGSIAEAALRSDLAVSFTRTDVAHAGADWSLFGDDTDEVAMVRVVAGDGTSAVFALTRCAPQPFDANDLDTIEEVSSLLAVTLERVKLFEEAEYHARHDALTGLANIRTLNQEAPAIDHAIESGQPVAVLVIDMDGLKEHNDTYGHASGDEAIQIVAREIALACRLSDLVVRSGGDEFVMVMRGADALAALDAASRVHDGLVSAAGDTSWPATHLRVSIGVAVAGVHGHGFDELLLAADQAMYEAKLSGGGCTRVAGEGAPTVLGQPGRSRGERILEGLLATALASATVEEATRLRRVQEAAIAAARECGLTSDAMSAVRFLVAADSALRLAAGPGMPAAAIDSLAAAVARGAPDGDGFDLRDFARAAVEIGWGAGPAHGVADYDAAARSAAIVLPLGVREVLLDAFRRLDSLEARAA